MAARIPPEGVPPLADDDRSRPGRTSSTRKSTSRTSAISPRRSGKSSRPWTKWIRNCCAPSKSWACRCTSAQTLAGVAVDVIFDSVSVATTYKKKLAEVGVIFCSFSEAVKDHPELVKKYLGIRGAGRRQFLCRAQLRGVHRRLVLFHPQGRALPDGSVDILPHQHRAVGPVRAHVDHRRRGRLRVLPRRLYGAEIRHQPVACGGGGTGCAGRCRNQVFDSAELVRGRRERQGWHLQFRDQARSVQGSEFEDFLDPGRDRFGDHLEVSVLCVAGRQLCGRVLFGGTDQPSPAGRYRYQDDPHRAGTPAARSSPRAFPPGFRTTAIAAW